jgi:hypothetical protein
MQLRFLPVVAGLGLWALTAMTDPQVGNAQGAITGAVTDSATKKPIAGVTLTVVGTDLRSKTGDDGTYRLAPVSAGDRVVRAVLTGYTTVEHTIAVSDTGAVTLDFELAPAKKGGSNGAPGGPVLSKADTALRSERGTTRR